MTEPITEHDTTYQRLIDAAEIVFAEVGYEAASVRDICHKADVKNVGAVNYYFQGKEKLYRETVLRAFRFCHEGAPFPDWPVGKPAEEKLRDFIHVICERMLRTQRISALQLMMREMNQPSPVCVEAILENINPTALKLREILDELIPELPMRQRWMIGLSIVGQCLFYRQNRFVIEILMGGGRTRQHADGLAQESHDLMVNPLTVEEITDHIERFSFAALGLAKPLHSKKTASETHTPARGKK